MSAQVSPPTTCHGCDGEGYLFVARGSVEFEVPCIICCCQICGKAGAGPECGAHFDEEDARAVRREDR